jgi:hypothetical protein
VADQICVRVLVYQEANCESFWSGTIVYIWYVWDTTANGEACHGWSRRIAEVRSKGYGFRLLSWSERSLYEEPLGMSLEYLVNYYLGYKHAILVL